MPEFKFFIDRKISSWDRDRYTVQAEDQDEAIEFMKKVFNKELPIEDMLVPNHVEMMDDTEADLFPTECDPDFTQELFLDLENDCEVPICNNAVPPIK